MLVNERHRVHTLVQQELRRKNTLIHPDIGPGKIRAALAIAGLGLDHHQAEQAMALNHNDDWQVFTLVTDRRVLGAVYQERYAVPLARIAAVKVENSMLRRRVVVQLTGGDQAYLVNDAFHQPIAAFLQQIAAMPPEARTPPPRPLCVTTAQDPTGALGALTLLGEEQGRSALLLRFVAAAHTKAEMPDEVAHDFVRRIVLMHRNLHFGRGMAEGRWLSPVCANDLCNAFVQLYGDPLSHEELPVRTLLFQSGLHTQHGKAALSSAVGLASAAILGVGWTSSARRRLDRFRLMVADTPSAASYRLQAPSGKGLEQDEPNLQNEIDGKLLGLEDDLLLRRVLYGWRPTTMQLLDVGVDALQAKLAETLG
ncbi:MAG: PH domain-containing protein [Deltaproteobacteria bacterium]|nr:PH domain-containing protein [Deltaproteobacteria bacterium]